MISIYTREYSAHEYSQRSTTKDFRVKLVIHRAKFGVKFGVLVTDILEAKLSALVQISEVNFGAKLSPSPPPPPPQLPNIEVRLLELIVFLPGHCD